MKKKNPSTNIPLFSYLKSEQQLRTTQIANYLRKFTQNCQLFTQIYAKLPTIYKQNSYFQIS